MDEEPVTPVLHIVSWLVRYVKVSCHEFTARPQEVVETTKHGFPNSRTQIIKEPHYVNEIELSPFLFKPPGEKHGSHRSADVVNGRSNPQFFFNHTDGIGCIAKGRRVLVEQVKIKIIRIFRTSKNFFKSSSRFFELLLYPIIMYSSNLSLFLFLRKKGKNGNILSCW